VAGKSARPCPEEILTAKYLTSEDAASELPVSMIEAPGQIGTAAAAATSTAVPSSVKVTAASSQVLAPPAHDVARKIRFSRYYSPRHRKKCTSSNQGSNCNSGVDDVAGNERGRDIAHHVIGLSVNQDTSVQNADDDVVSDVYQALL